MNPQELLRAADALLTGAFPSMRRCWQRACAALLRAALEQALHQYWQRRAPSVTGASMRIQLLVLPTFAGDTAAATARGAWNDLCRAVHHRSYELAPTAGELRGWYTDVVRLLAQLSAKAGPSSRTGPDARSDGRASRDSMGRRSGGGRDQTSPRICHRRP